MTKDNTQVATTFVFLTDYGKKYVIFIELWKKGNAHMVYWQNIPVIWGSTVYKQAELYKDTMYRSTTVSHIFENL